MTDREQLIELIINFVESFDCGNCKPSNDKCKKCLSENEADYLLEHGVIVPSELGIKDELLEWINKDCNKTKHSTKEG